LWLFRTAIEIPLSIPWPTLAEVIRVALQQIAAQTIDGNLEHQARRRRQHWLPEKS
jgi:hypothetical protein